MTPTPKKSASVYLRKGKLFMHAWSKTPGGVGVISEPFVSCGIDDLPALGESLLQVLAGSKQYLDMPPQDELKARGVSFCLLAGVKSWGTFSRPSQLVQARHEGEVISFVPTNKEVKGFSHLLDKTRTTSSNDPPEIARLLLAAFDDCT